MTTVTDGRRVAGEVAAQLIADLASRGRARQHAVVGEAPLHPEERHAEQQQQRDDGKPDRDRAADDELASSGTRTLLDGRRPAPAGCRAACQPAHIQCVEPAPSSTMAAGVTTTAAIAANATVAIPA